MFVVRLRDCDHESPYGATIDHYARPGHVNALCGAARLSNADVVGEDPDPGAPATGPMLLPTCDECLRLASESGYRHPVGGTS